MSSFSVQTRVRMIDRPQWTSSIVATSTPPPHQLLKKQKQNTSPAFWGCGVQRSPPEKGASSSPQQLSPALTLLQFSLLTSASLPRNEFLLRIWINEGNVTILQKTGKRGITVKRVLLIEGWHTQASKCGFILLNTTLSSFKQNAPSFIVFKGFWLGLQGL